MRILVVEDEAGIADFLRRGLAAEGYDVVCASDGADGEARALSGRFDLVLLDLMLPGKDGREVLSTIRRVLPIPPSVVEHVRRAADACPTLALRLDRATRNGSTAAGS
jgi:DNA-binding response OmpR family regulator